MLQADGAVVANAEVMPGAATDPSLALLLLLLLLLLLVVVGLTLLRALVVGCVA